MKNNCNSKRVLCDDVKNLCASVCICLLFLLASWKRKNFLILNYVNYKNIGQSVKLSYIANIFIIP